MRNNQKTYFTFLILVSFLFSSISLEAQQTSFGVSYRPDYKKDFTWNGSSFPIALLTEGWSNSVGIQFQHVFANERWGFRLGLFYLNRIKAFTVGVFLDPTASTPIEGTLRKKSVYMSIPLELIFKAKPKLEIGLGLTSHHFIFSSTSVNNETVPVMDTWEAPIHVGVINSLNWIMFDKKWFNVKVGTTAIWPIESKTFIAGFQLSSSFKFP